MCQVFLESRVSRVYLENQACPSLEREGHLGWQVLMAYLDKRAREDRQGSKDPQAMPQKVYLDLLVSKVTRVNKDFLVYLVVTVCLVYLARKVTEVDHAPSVHLERRERKVHLA